MLIQHATTTVFKLICKTLRMYVNEITFQTVQFTMWLIYETKVQTT